MFTKYNHTGQGYQLNDCMTPDVNNNTTLVSGNGAPGGAGATNGVVGNGSGNNNDSTVASSNGSSSSSATGSVVVTSSAGSSSYHRSLKVTAGDKNKGKVEEVDDEETMNACYSINFDEAENSDSDHEFYGSSEGTVSTNSTGSPNVSGTNGNASSAVDMVNKMVSGNMIMNNSGLGNGANNAAHFYNPHHLSHMNIQPHHYHHSFNNSFNGTLVSSPSSMSGIHYSTSSSKRNGATSPTESPSSDNIDFGLSDSPKVNRNVHCVKEKLRRDRIKISCNQLRRLIPSIDGFKTDMASLLETSVLWARLVNANVPEQYLHTIRAELATLATLKSSTTTTTSQSINLNHLYNHQPQCNKSIEYMYMNNNSHHLHHPMMSNVASSQMNMDSMSKSNNWPSSAGAASSSPSAAAAAAAYNKYFTQNVQAPNVGGSPVNVSNGQGRIIPQSGSVVVNSSSVVPPSQCYTSPASSNPEFGFYETFMKLNNPTNPGYSYPR